VHHEVGTLRQEMLASQRALFFGILGAFTANTGIVLTAIAFMR
jgi:hypothetical protein